MKFLVAMEERFGEGADDVLAYSVIVPNWRHVKSMLRTREVLGITKSFKRWPEYCSHRFHKHLMKVLESTNED